MKIKFRFGQPMLNYKEEREIKKVLKSKILVHGNVSKKFEDNFKKYTGSKYAISVSSCTAGMHLVYFCLGLKKGDEILVPSQTHVSTAHSVELTGAKAVFVDCDKDTGNILVKEIEKKITSKTKAIAIVHFLGIPNNIVPIKKIVKKYNLFLLEDCALAIGAKYYKKHVGLIGDVGVFSFYPVKHITTAEGGMVITNNLKLAKKIRLLRGFGVNKIFSERSRGLYNCDHLGFNYRMSEIHASIGNEQLNKLPNFLKVRKKNFETLYKKLKDLKNISIIRSKNKNLESSNYCLSLILKNKLAKKRNIIIEELNKLGVGTSIYYPIPVPRMNYYKNKYGYKKTSFKNAEIISDNSISLPVGPHLKQNQMINIAKILISILKKYE